MGVKYWIKAHITHRKEIKAIKVFVFASMLLVVAIQVIDQLKEEIENGEIQQAN